MMRSCDRRRRGRVFVVGAFVLAACSGGDDASPGGTEPPEAVPEASDDVADSPEPPDATASADDTGDGDEPGDASGSGDRSLEQLVDAITVPTVSDAAAELPCEKLGFACDVLSSGPEMLAASVQRLNQLSTAIAASSDAREQLHIALSELEQMDDVFLIDIDLDNATMLSFIVDDGPRLSIFTEAAVLREDGDVPPVDEEFKPAAGAVSGFAGTGFASGPAPRRYEPAGGPTVPKTAAIFDPFDWGASEIQAIFAAEDQYTTVDVYTAEEVNPFTVDLVSGYDAVHILSHGGGSCPSWTDDRDECSSTFVGGPIDSDEIAEQMADRDVSIATNFTLCAAGGVNRYCFPSDGFAANPNGIQFFAVCGSDAGFNNTGAGASVGWTGTTQLAVARRTAVTFWDLMVTKGAEFELAAEVVQGRGDDSHSLTWWASGGAVNMFTEAVFAGRNLRARDVVEFKVDGELAMGQVVEFEGLPSDGTEEQLPFGEQTLTIELEGVRDGTEAAVQFEIRGDGEVWESDIDLQRDGVRTATHEGFADWRVTLNPGSVKVPDVSSADLSVEAPPIDLEVRAFENAAEYTAFQGVIRLATDLESTGPIPVYTELESALSGIATVDGNDLRVRFNTAEEPVTGEMLVTVEAAGAEGFWSVVLNGTYDPSTGRLSGTADAVAQGDAGFGVRVGETGSGTFDGTADLDARRVNLTITINGQSQSYSGAIVRPGESAR